MAAGLDDRVKAMVSQVPIADGRDWLHRMRREHEWLEFLERLAPGSPAAGHDRQGRDGRAPRRDHGPDPGTQDDARSRATSTTGSRARSRWPAPRRSSTTARSTSSTGSRRGPLMFICVENDCDDARGPHLRPVRAGRRAEAPRRPDRHDPLRRLRAVPRRRQPADRRVVRALPRRAARSTVHEGATPDAAIRYVAEPVARGAGCMSDLRPRDPRRHASSRRRAGRRPTSRSATDGSRRSSRRARRSTASDDDRRDRPAPPARR